MKPTIVGCKETVEHSFPHIPFADGVDWVGVSLSNPCPLKIGEKSVEFRALFNTHFRVVRFSVLSHI